MQTKTNRYAKFSEFRRLASFHGAPRRRTISPRYKTCPGVPLFCKSPRYAAVGFKPAHDACLRKTKTPRKEARKLPTSQIRSRAGEMVDLSRKIDRCRKLPSYTVLTIICAAPLSSTALPIKFSTIA
jgi:hypothetical protein